MNWYNNEYDRFTGYADRGEPSLREIKMREEFSNYQEPDKEALDATRRAMEKEMEEHDPPISIEQKKDELLEEYRELEKGLEEFDEALEGAKRALVDLCEFLDKVRRGHAIK